MSEKGHNRTLAAQTSVQLGCSLGATG